MTPHGNVPGTVVLVYEVQGLAITFVLAKPPTGGPRHFMERYFCRLGTARGVDRDTGVMPDFLTSSALSFVAFQRGVMADQRDVTARKLEGVGFEVLGRR